MGAAINRDGNNLGVFSDLQIRHKVWAGHNFPDTKAERPYIGMIEELGELAHAELKIQQQIRGSEEDHLQAAKDAVGDFCIYLMHYCNILGEKIKDVEKGAFVCSDQFVGIRVLLDSLNSLDSLSLGSLEKSRVTSVLVVLDGYCCFRGWDLNDVVIKTWEKVEKRDWINNPDSAHLES